MKITIIGASGFLGTALAKYYIKKGAEVHMVSRHNPKIANAHFHPWDGKTLGPWTSSLEKADLLINMAGKSVNCSYTSQNKQSIYNSRLDSTSVIGMAILQNKYPPKLWLNSSSATIYRHADDRPQDEPTGELGNDFSPDVCKKWEAAFFAAQTPHTLKYALRSAIVLGEGGGVLPVLKKLVRLGLGGKQGSGRQKVSWIHISDFINAVAFIASQKLPEGIYNVCAPNPTDNQTLMAHLRKRLNIKIGLPANKWMLSLGALLIGTEPELVLKSRWVVPTKLLQAGFVFEKNYITDI